MTDETLAGDGNRPLSLALKLSYGSGQTIDAALQAGVNVFLLFYLTTVCGMSGAAAGLVFFVSLVVDALLDPLIGQVSDNCRSRLGRRLPFMAGAMLPMMVAVALLFSIPKGLSDLALFAYALGLNVVLRVSLSLFSLPYSALTAELTNDYTERSVIAGFRALFMIVGTMMCVIPAFQLIFTGPDGLQSRDAYPLLGIWLALVALCFGAWCVLGIRRVMLDLPMPSAISRDSRGNLTGEIWRLFRNPSFVPLFVASVLVLISMGVSTSLNMHAYRYFWKMPPELLQLPILITPVGMIVGTTAAAFLVRRFEKRDLVVAAVFGATVGPIILPILQLSGALAPGSSMVVALLIANGLVFGICAALCTICFTSMVADAVDEHDHLFGVRCEALYAAALMFGAKAATGIGGLIAGLGLQFVGFSVERGAASISPGSITSLGILWGPGSTVLLFAAIPFLRRYTVDKHHHAAIIADLARRAARPAPSHSVAII